MTKQTEMHPPFWKRSPAIAAIVAVLAVSAVALGVYVTQTPYLRGEDAVFEGEQGIRPAGAGSAPDGAADTEFGGLEEGMNPDAAVDQTINADNVPALIQQEEGTGLPQTSAEGLEPIDGSDGAILPEIADETEMRVPDGAGGSAEAEGPSGGTDASDEDPDGETSQDAASGGQ